MKAKMLSREEERDLIRRWQDDGDERAMQKLITAHVPLVYKMARKMKGYRLPHDDLVQEGILGLIDALRLFDMNKGYRFSTLARWYVLSFMQEYIVANYNIVKNPNTTKHRTAFFKGERKSHISLDAIAGTSGEGETNMDFLIDGNPNPEEITEAVIDGERMKERLRRILEDLPPRSADIVKRRFMNDDQEILATIAADHKISRERVRQIEQKALKVIKAELAFEGEN